MKSYLAPTSLLLASTLALSGCGEKSHFSSDTPRIKQGIPATVLQHTFTTESAGKAGPKGYHLFLKTEDCPSGKEFTPGPGTTVGCKVVSHLVEPNTFLNFPQDSSVVWEDAPSPSEVLDRYYTTDDYMTTIHNLGLFVRQCVGQDPNTQCYDNTVKVNPADWVNIANGQTVTFHGPMNTLAH